MKIGKHISERASERAKERLTRGLERGPAPLALVLFTRQVRAPRRPGVFTRRGVMNYSEKRAGGKGRVRKGEQVSEISIMRLRGG